MSYHDNRAHFWKKHYEMALPYEEYLKTDPEKAVRWREFESRAPTLSGEQKKRVQDYNREINILVMVGIWCGDCVRTTLYYPENRRSGGRKSQHQVHRTRDQSRTSGRTANTWSHQSTQNSIPDRGLLGDRQSRRPIITSISRKSRKRNWDEPRRRSDDPQSPPRRN